MSKRFLIFILRYLTVFIIFFRWKKLSCGKWRGVIQKHVFTLDRDETNVFAEVHDNKNECSKTTKSQKNNKSNSNESKIESYVICFTSSILPSIPKMGFFGLI